MTLHYNRTIIITIMEVFKFKIFVHFISLTVFNQPSWHKILLWWQQPAKPWRWLGRRTSKWSCLCPHPHSTRIFDWSGRFDSVCLGPERVCFLEHSCYSFCCPFDPKKKGMACACWHEGFAHPKFRGGWCPHVLPDSPETEGRGLILHQEFSA